MITTDQIRSVLRVYGNQLKRRSDLQQERTDASTESADIVDISIEARKKQVLNQISNTLISRVAPKHEQPDTAGKAGAKENPSEPAPAVDNV